MSYICINVYNVWNKKSYCLNNVDPTADCIWVEKGSDQGAKFCEKNLLKVDVIL